MSRKGTCDENAMMESWHRFLKKEIRDLTTFRSREEAERAILADIERVYHRPRAHRVWDYQTPAEAAYQRRSG